MQDHNAINKFISERFGDCCVTALERQNLGGSNNFKGNRYEQQFVLFKAFDIASHNIKNLADHQISQQEYGFVDDVCHIDFKNLTKHNFQLKNSEKSAADWTGELQDKFMMQHAIDTEHLSYKNSRNTLVVSSQDKQTLNSKKIRQSELEPSICSCIYIPDCQNLLEMYTKTTLKDNVKNLLRSGAGDSEVDYAVNLVRGILQSNGGKCIAVEDIFKQAQSEANPNPFIRIPSIRQEQFLEYRVKNLLDNYSQIISYQVQYESNMVAFNKGGFSWIVPLDAINKLTDKECLAVKSIDQLIEVLLQLTAQSLICKTKKRYESAQLQQVCQ